MKKKYTYSLAYSSCPNDTFIFKAIAQNYIDLKNINFNIHLNDVETLNQYAAKQQFNITKLSFAALGNLLDKYALLRSGAALGRGCGPLIISLPGKKIEKIKKPVRIAVPGLWTTAYHLFCLYMQDCFPQVTFQPIPISFEQIMSTVKEEKADLGLLIHEGRFIFKNQGFKMLTDLGQWWEDKTGLAIPLGCIVIQRNLGPQIASTIEALIRKSIDHGFKNPDLGRSYIQSHAQTMDEDVIEQHIRLYVNHYSLNIGPAGEKAVVTFFDYARKAGLIKGTNYSLFSE